METKDTGSSDWPEDEPQTEQKVTLEDYQQLIIQMRRANVQFQQLCNIPSGELTMLLTLRRLSASQNICHSIRYRRCAEAVKTSRIPNAS